jgi:heptosyltransferase-1
MIFMRIAIVKLSALGDIVHAMVVLQFIKKYNPKIEIDWIVDQSYEEIVELHPDINKVYSLDIKNVKKKKSIFLFLSEIKKIRTIGPYDIVIDMQGLIKSAIIAKSIPSKSILGFDKSSSREGISSIFYKQKFKIGYHENIIERNFELIKFALSFPFDRLEIMNKNPFLHSNQKYQSSILSNTRKNIILIPGASNSSKRYPLEKFARLPDLIEANFIVIWGNEEERLISEKIKVISPSVNLCEKLSITSLIALFKEVDLVIGGDTGPTHIAWALNIPSISIFGSTPEYRNAYVDKTHKVVKSSSTVDPYKINQSDYSIQEIEVKEIVAAAKKLLN